MSEEKLYAVKNDDGMLLLYSEQGAPLWRVWGNMFADKSAAERAANAENGRVVTLIEEPEKVVVSPEEAKLLKNCLWSNLRDAFLNNIILLFRSRRPEDITRLKSALINGYTVAKEKTWLLPVPSSWCGDSNHYWHKESDGTLTWSILAGRSEGFEFSRNEIAKYGMNGFKKEEVTDDDD